MLVKYLFLSIPYGQGIKKIIYVKFGGLKFVFFFAKLNLLGMHINQFLFLHLGMHITFE
jgi:hypothetical protein